jgi:hypothetical protein
LLASDDPGGGASGDVEHAQRRDEGGQAKCDSQQTIDDTRGETRGKADEHRLAGTESQHLQ